MIGELGWSRIHHLFTLWWSSNCEITQQIVSLSLNVILFNSLRKLWSSIWTIFRRIKHEEGLAKWFASSLLPIDSINDILRRCFSISYTSFLIISQINILLNPGIPTGTRIEAKIIAKSRDTILKGWFVEIDQSHISHSFSFQGSWKS